MNPLYELVAERAQHACEYCCAPELVFNFPFEVEHVMPRAQGGATELGNLALACHGCNLFKGQSTTGFDEASATTVALFDPRAMHWPDHFQIDESTAKIVGLTAVGRATIGRLRMNNPAQISARQQWIAAKLFP